MAQVRRRMLAVVGVVATAAGSRGVLVGAREVSGSGPVTPTVDSEYRFYAAWYGVLGSLALRAARSPEPDPVIARACAGGFFVAACGRLLSLRQVGRPNRFQQVLLVVELVVAAVLSLPDRAEQRS